VLAGVPTKVAVFVLSLPSSGAVYCQVFPRECTETFQEGHVRAFAFFGGVPKTIHVRTTRKTAVKTIVGPRDRELTREFLRLKSHYLFDSHFCLSGGRTRRGTSSGLVEYARSNFLVPVPAVDFAGAVERGVGRAVSAGPGPVGPGEGIGGRRSHRRPGEDAPRCRLAGSTPDR